jgi:uncharacterized membrane protein
VPHGPGLAALTPLLPVFLSYVLSFVYLGIYWNNHRHMLQTVHRVSGGILWANLHLLFWLSLVPFATGWMGENELATGPTALYGIVLLMAAISYYILQRAIIDADVKGRVSPLLYVAGILAAFVLPWLAAALYVLVAVIWLVPDRRIERALVDGATTGR